MGLSIAGIDLADSVINTEFRIGVLERIVDRLIRAAPPGTLTEVDIENIRQEVIESMKKKWPEANIRRTG